MGSTNCCSKNITYSNGKEEVIYDDKEDSFDKYFDELYSKSPKHNVKNKCSIHDTLSIIDPSTVISKTKNNNDNTISNNVVIYNNDKAKSNMQPNQKSIKANTIRLNIVNTFKNKNLNKPSSELNNIEKMNNHKYNNNNNNNNNNDKAYDKAYDKENTIIKEKEDYNNYNNTNLKISNNNKNNEAKKLSSCDYKSVSNVYSNDSFTKTSNHFNCLLCKQILVNLLIN